MGVRNSQAQSGLGLGMFEQYLTLWVLLCIGAGILLGKIAPEAARSLDGLAIYVGGAPVVSIPIAVALFFMMYPLMVKIDFGEVVRAGKNTKPVLLAPFVNWRIKPFTMLGIATLVLLFTFKGETIVENPLTILWIAIPLFLQTWLIFGITYGLARLLRFRYEDAAPSAMIGASNHFEVAIATATMLYGLSSGAALATVVGVLIEVPVMLMLVRVCLRTQGWFAPGSRRVVEVV